MSSQLPAQAGSEERFPLPERSSSVHFGRQDYLSVVLRLVGMELYKIRRRTMSKILVSIAAALAILLFVAIAAGVLFVQNAPLENTGNTCPPGQSTSCTTPSPDELKAQRKIAVEALSTPLRLPASLTLIVQVALTPATILIIILVGTIVGGEYSVGTIRLLYTRGPTRTQFLLGKLGAAFVCSALGLLLMVLLGILTGQLLNPVSGTPQTFDFLTADWIGRTLLYILIAVFDWFIYAVIALFFGLLGQATAAGIVAALMWYFIEPILSGILELIGNINHNAFGDFLKAIPDYFISNNMTALLANPSNLHALIVLICYFIVFIGLAWWINARRDVTT
ncbi:MAG TPA: ABC transporter permease [Ktedonobacteraceae bacterium]|nr:ABC transporter permease [Ktedonobacteraceae bacterium]